MSKRNRNKFRDRDRQISPVHTVSPVRMAAGDGAAGQHAAEYRVIKSDMIRLIVLNGIMLIAVFLLYYTNRSSGYLERLFEKIF